VKRGKIMSEKALDRLVAVIVFVIPLVVYLMTMAATVSFWDSGEFIATSYILGIPHSPGTPLYVLVGRVFTMLPLPMTIAQRVNFLSVVFAALAVLMAYLITAATIRFMHPEPVGSASRFIRYAAPFVGAMYLTFSDTFWRDSTEAEVYALSAFVMGLCTWLALEWYRNPAGRLERSMRPEEAERDGRETREAIEKEIYEEARTERTHARGLVYLIIYLLALGVGFHLGTVLVFGGILLLFLLVKEKAFGNAELIVFTFGLAVLMADMTMHRSSGVTIGGLVIFAILVAWSTMTKGRFALVATGLLALGISVHLFLYIRSHMSPAINEVDPRTWKALYAHLRREQYPPMNIFERKASLAFQLAHFGRYFKEQFRMFGDLRIGPFNLGQAATAIPVALGLLGIAANYRGERKVWVLNVVNLLVNSLGLIVFLNFSASEVRERDYFYAPAFYFFAVFIGIGVASVLMTAAEHAKSKGRETLGYVAPLGMILIVLSILPAHHNWFTHDRHKNYIPREYAYNLLAGVAPDAVMFTNGDNDTFPLWYMQYVEGFRTDVRVANLSLLNTDWYIRQLRDEEPKVPITLNNEAIERLRPIALKGGGVAWRRDLAVQHIIQTTNWKRPIYFATTVPFEIWKPYEQYLEMQGMVRRLVARTGENMINEFLLQRNFDEIYKFHGVLTKDRQVDTTLYRDKDTEGMFVNFAIALAQLAQEKAIDGKYDEAIRRMEIALRLDPTLKAAKILLGTYLMMAGQDREAVEHYIRMIKEEPTEGEYWLRLARIYEFEGQLPFALQNINEGLRLAPEFRQLYIDGFRVAGQMGEGDTAKAYIRRWLALHPDDVEMEQVLIGADRLLEEEFGVSPDSLRRGKKGGT
jgi:tetratricopeptide (TPR) repeat protein